MQSWTLAVAVALLSLSCYVSPSLGDVQYMDLNLFNSVGTVSFEGSKLRVFEVDGAQVAEPRVAFDSSCSSPRYSRVYMKYQLVLPVRIDANTLRPSDHTSTKVVRVTITGLKVKANKALTNGESGLSLLVELKSSGKAADLVFLCNSFLRCRYLREEILSNPSDIGRALKFEAVGRLGGTPVRFGTRRSANAPKLSCDPHRWVVFQRRVDGSLSFAQNWDAYVKGFGNPKSNYWMGLERLSEMTVTGAKNGYPLTARCGLRIETEDFSGQKYSAEFKMFEVLGVEQQYRLRIGLQVGRSTLGDALLHFHNEIPFSTFDRDNDGDNGGSCSQLYGYGGWWFKACHSVNLNGAYTTDKSIKDNPTYCSFHIGSGYVPMKRSLMKFKCY